MRRVIGAHEINSAVIQRRDGGGAIVDRAERRQHDRKRAHSIDGAYVYMQMMRSDLHADTRSAPAALALAQDLEAASGAHLPRHYPGTGLGRCLDQIG